MSFQDVKQYVTHLFTFRVMICRFCEVCISPKEPLRHYEYNHTSGKDHSISMNVRRKIADYMATLDLCKSQEVASPVRLISELRVIKEEFKCNFPDCRACGTSEQSMRQHYYSHQKHISKEFKNWESTSLQTFFESHHRKYDNCFVC